MRGEDSLPLLEGTYLLLHVHEGLQVADDLALELLCSLSLRGRGRGRGGRLVGEYQDEGVRSSPQTW